MQSPAWSTVSGTCRGRKPRSAGAARGRSGFTVVELVLVIVIVGVLGALAGPRFFDNRSFSERAYAEELASMLRYAQKVAVGSGCRVRVQVAAAAYDLMQQAASGGHCDAMDTGYPVPVGLPSGESAAGSAPPGVTVGTPLVVVFDALGRSNLASDQALSVGTHTLTIGAGSGLVTGP
ncbi:MAG TPA: GspH/FimT family pseudopilin [Woeseiaceae bacterium]|nr:GspH/FimT family pseudopilin [Woeseiaceae bacterium]